MIWNNQILFLHVPKTGGMSITEFLLENLKGPVSYTAEVKKKGLKRRAIFHEGQRHETLVDAESYFTYRNRSVLDFEAVFAVMRNPYDLEVSRYHYLRQGYKVDKGPAQDLAMAGDFGAYLREAAFFGAFPPRLDRYYRFGSSIPPNLRIIRYERLEDDLRTQLGPHLTKKTAELPRLNATQRDRFSSYYDEETAELCYQRHRWFFDTSFYPRWTDEPVDVPEPEPTPAPPPAPPRPRWPETIPEELVEESGTLGSATVARRGLHTKKRLLAALGADNFAGRRILDLGGEADLGSAFPVRNGPERYLCLDENGPLIEFLRAEVGDDRLHYGHLAVDGGLVAGEIEWPGDEELDAQHFDVVWIGRLGLSTDDDDLLALLRFARRRVEEGATLVCNVNLRERSRTKHGMFDYFIEIFDVDDEDAAAAESTVEPSVDGKIQDLGELSVAMYSRHHLTEVVTAAGWTLVDIVEPARFHRHTMVCRATA